MQKQKKQQPAFGEPYRVDQPKRDGRHFVFHESMMGPKVLETPPARRVLP